MKKILIVGTLLTLLTPIMVNADAAVSEEKELVESVVKETDLLKNAKSGILIEESTGNIIYKKNENEKVAVASMTKMIAQIIILENIEEKKIKWDDIVEVSKNAADMGGSQIYLSTGEKMSIKDLFKGISMASANDATVAMAEYLSGTEEKFVKLMNNKVKELGLKNTHFTNSTGLDEDNHYSTAYDMSIIAKELIRHKEIFDYSSVYEDYLRQNTDNKFWLVNTNKLIKQYTGADGLKTGHTDAALYCLAATAKKDNMRLIAIVLGEKESKVRNSETIELLDYGYNNYSLTKLKSKNEVLKKIKLEKTNPEVISLKSEKDISILEEKNRSKTNYKYEIKINNIKLPIKKGDKVGTISVKQDNKTIKKINLISNTNIKRQNFIDQFNNNLNKTLTGTIN